MAVHPVVRAKDGNVRRIDYPFRGILFWTSAVLPIHRIVDECLMKSTGPTKHLLLRSGSAKETTTGLDSVGEIQGKRPQSAGHETP